MNQYEQQLAQWINESPRHIRALQVAGQLALPQWMLAAGFVRNLAWDRLHGFNAGTFTDIDVIYFDSTDLSTETERHYEAKLRDLEPEYPWSVKNQARMHLNNGDQPYTSSLDAMGYWPEKETAIGVCLIDVDDVSADKLVPESQTALTIHAVFGLESLFQLKITHNPERLLTLFHHRVRTKGWLDTYPNLQPFAYKL